MYICVCNAITDKQIREAADAGARDVWDLQARLGVASNCGSCRDTAAEILQEHRSADRKAIPHVYVPAMA